MSDMAESTKREKWISIYKGIAILLVVLGHLEISGTLYRVVFSFHMYAFFFIAGVTFHDNKSLKTYFYDSVKRLIIPYFVFAYAWDITHLVQVYYLQRTIDLSPVAIVKNVVSVVLCDNIAHSNASIGPAWFLFCLLIVRVEYYLINALGKRLKAKYLPDVLCVALFVVGYLCRGINGLPFKIIPAQTAILFYHIGFAVKNRKLTKISVSKKLKPVICIGLLVLTLLSLLANADVELISNAFPDNIVLFVIPALSGTFALMFLSQTIESIGGGGYFTRFITAIGDMSLVILGTHSEIHILTRLILEKAGLKTKYTVIPVFIITIAASFGFTYIFRKFFPVLIGEKSNKKSLS